MGYNLLSELVPHMTKWTIKCKLLSKEKSYHFTKNGQFGTVINMYLIDEQDSIVKATMFSDIITRFDRILSEGHFYLVSNGQIKEANPTFNKGTTSANIIFNAETTIEEIPPFKTDSILITEPDVTKNLLSNNFVTINKLFEERKVDEIIDLVAVVIKSDEPALVTRKADGTKIMRQNLTLTDNSSDRSIILTLWENLVKNEGELILKSIENRPVILATSLRAHSFQGNFGLKTTQRTTIDLSSTIDIVVNMQRWVKSHQDEITRRINGEKAENMTDLKAELVTVKELKDNSEKGILEPNLFKVKIWTVSMNRSEEPWYNACSHCNKTLIGQDGKLFCEKCSSSEINVIQRYFLRLEIADETGNIWVTLFNNEAKRILGHSIEDLKKKKENNVSDFINIMETCLRRQFFFTIKVNKKIGNLQGFNYTCVEMEKVEMTEYNNWERIYNMLSIEDHRQLHVQKIKRQKIHLEED